MNSDDLEQTLLSEKQIEASSTFTRNVMLRVRDESPYPRAIPFPWIPFAATALILMLVTVLHFPAASYAGAMNAAACAIGQWIVAHSAIGPGNALLSGLAALLGTLFLVKVSISVSG